MPTSQEFSRKGTKYRVRSGQSSTLFASSPSFLVQMAFSKNKRLTKSGSCIKRGSLLETHSIPRGFLVGSSSSSRSSLEDALDLLGLA